MRVRRVPGTALANATTGETTYTPPEGESAIRDMLANWERFLQQERDLDPLIRLAIAHYQFEAIHPFTDGNGRTGRVLNQGCPMFLTCTETAFSFTASLLPRPVPRSSLLHPPT